MESTEPLEPPSSGQDIQNPEANGSEPSTSNGANAIEPREVTFDQFVETCKTELSDEANPPEQIVRQLTTFREKHVASPVWKNNALKQILSHFDWTIRLEPDFSAKALLLHDFKEEFKRLDRYLSTLKSKNKKEQANLQKKIKKLQTQIKKDLRKIDRLDQEELSIEDLDKPDSAHLKKEKYERRVINASRRLFNLQGMNANSIRILDKPFKYSGTQYPVLNDAVSSKYRAIMQKKYQGRGPPRPVNSTPNIRDITDIIKDVSTQNNLTIPNIDELALRIADDLIREVQRRRDLEYQEMMNDYEHDSHLRPETFADLGDEELNKQLSSNEETGLAKIRQIMSTLESTGDADIGGDEPPSEEEEDEEDPMDALEEDEDISEAEESDAEVENAEEDDDDDDPVILEEEAKPQNGDSQVPESTETTETKKRPVESESTPDELLKKPKIEESQETKESISSNVENKNEETEQEIKEMLPSNESNDTKEKIVDEVPKVSEIEPLENTVKKEVSEKECLDAQPENPNPSIAGPGEEKNEVLSSPPKTRSESEDSIKIVDLEAETRSNDEQSTFNDDMIDDDDVICLD